MPNSVLNVFEFQIGVAPGNYPTLASWHGPGVDDKSREAYQLEALRSWLIAQGIPRDGEHGCGKSTSYTLRKAYAEPRYLNGWKRRIASGRGWDDSVGHRASTSRSNAASAIFDDLTAVEDSAETKEQNALADIGDAMAESGAKDSITATTEAIARAADVVIGQRLDALRLNMRDFITQEVKGTKLELSAEAKVQFRELIVKTTRETLEALVPKRIEIHDPETGTSRDLGIQHETFPKLLRAAQARLPNGFKPNIWLTGPAGSGKTTAVEMIAKALYVNKRPDPDLLALHGLTEAEIGFDFDSGPMGGDGSLDADYKVIGFKDANGKFHWTAFLKCFVFGYPYCADEIDNWLPSALLSINGALANGWISTPNGILKRQRDLLVVACANTWGLGATNDYVGRTKLDAASLDRFQPKINWPIDEALESSIAAELGGRDWCKIVQEVRRKAKAQGLQIIISPRATYAGISLLAAGFEINEVIDMTFAAGLKPEQRKSLGIDALTQRSQWQLYADAAS